MDQNIPFHTHDGINSPQVDDKNISNHQHFILFRIVGNSANTSVANIVGGDFVIPFNGYVVEVGATVDTAGTTGPTTIDVNLNGTSIMYTKITIDSGIKTSRKSATQSILLDQSRGFVVGDIFTFDVDAVSTTAATGLTIFMKVIRNT